MINDLIINSAVVKYGLDTKLPTKVVIHDSQTTYIGIAHPGIASTASSGWQIVKIVDTGTTTTISLANGNLNFDKIMDNYTSYDYLP